MTISDKPLVTALVVTYNQCDFVEEALASVLAQTYSPLQIVVSDDCSTDGTFEKIKSFLTERGRDDVEAVQTPRNGGLAVNLNFAISRVRGEIVVMFAGDDVSFPDRCVELVTVLGDTSRRVFAVTSDVHLCDDSGKVFGYQHGWSYPDALDACAFTRPGVSMLGAAAAYRLEVFSRFEPLPVGFDREDQIFPYRAGLLGDLAWLRHPLLLYRRHGSNMSGARAEGQLSDVAYREELKRVSEGHMALLNQKAAELEKVKAFDGVSRQRLAEVELALLESIASMKLFLSLFEKPVATAFTMLINAAKLKRPLRAVLREIAMVIFPSFWRRYGNRLR